MHNMNWDDLRILECCARTGSFAKAAEELGLSHSSISRRMTQLENSLQTTLLHRTATGVSLTEAGLAIHAEAKDMAAAAMAIHNTSEKASALAGRIRFETIDATALFLMPYLHEFTERHPEIEIDLRLNQQMVDLDRGEADVVLRATNSPPEEYVGYHVASHAFGIFGTAELINRYPPGTPLNDLPWVLWSDGWSDPMIKGLGLTPRTVMRASTANGVMQAMRAGIGVGHMACNGVSRDDRFLCLRRPDPANNLQIWLLAHHSMRRNRRIQAFIRFLRQKIVVDRPYFEGERGNVTRALNLPLR